MDKRLIILYCILFNLILGNCIVYFWSSPSINYDLMIGMSIASASCYFLALKYIRFCDWNVVKLLLFSIVLCLIIELFGCALAGIITGYSLGRINDILDVFTALGIGFVLGIIGNVMIFPITIVMGIINLYWFIKMKKTNEAV